MADVTQKEWAQLLLKRLGIRRSPGAVKAVLGWERAEGGHWNNTAHFNPLNTTQPEPGAGNTGTQGNIKVYRDWNQGLDATVKTLRNGHYGGILAALRAGNANSVAQAIGGSPWGTNGGLVARTIGSTKVGRLPPDPGVRTPPAYASRAGQPSQADIPSASPVNAGLDMDARKAAVMNFITQGGIRNSSATQALASTITSLNKQASLAVTPAAPATGATAPPPTTSHGSGRSNPARGIGGQLYELFWQGHNGINVKNGQPEPQGFVSGHTDHVHVAAGPRSVIRIGRLAEHMGLHVGENPHFGGVNPVHVPGSYHYKNEAIDVSSPDAALMAKFAHRVAKLYGVR